MMGVYMTHPRGLTIDVEAASPAARFRRARQLAREMVTADEAMHQASDDGTARDWRETYETAADGLMALLDLMEVHGLLAEIETFLATKYGG